MLAKPCIVGCILLLAVAVADAKHAISAVSAPPEIAGHGSTSHGKPVSEDSDPWRREPFKAAEEPVQRAGNQLKQELAGASPELALQGIMKSNRRFYAIINGRTVKSGDQIEGWTIAEISRLRVTIRREKEKQVYDIYQGRIDRGTK